MPSINAKREVRYTQADANALDAAHTILEFMAEFDKSAHVSGALAGIKAVREHVGKQRVESQVKKAATKPADSNVKLAS